MNNTKFVYIGEQNPPRQSNFELFRIITMLFIIAHHYVVNSGLTDMDGPIIQNQFCLKSIIYLLVGAWGKIGINCFIFITGYFMCKSQITLRKFLKLLLEIYFYKIVIWFVFFFAGYESFSLKAILNLLLPFTSLDKNFTGCFIVFQLCIPFVNLLLNNLTKKQHELLLIFALSVFSLFGCFFTISFSYVIWFCVLYLISSYVRLYENEVFSNLRLWILLSVVTFFLCCISVIGMSFIGSKLSKFAPYYFVADSNKFLAVITAFSFFMLFKNLDIGYSKVINTIASTCFGVLLIHAGSDVMRKWLWKEFLKNIEYYSSNYFYIHIILSIFGIFTVCCVFDLLRQFLFEKPLFVFFEKKDFIKNSFDV